MTQVPSIEKLRIVSVIEITLNDVPDSNWLAGPLPMTWRAGTPKEVTSDRAGRLYYLEDGLESCLYRRDDAPIRWHKHIDSHESAHIELTLESAEVLKVPSVGTHRRGLLALHLAASDPTAEHAKQMIYEATNFNSLHGQPMRDMAEGLVSGWAVLSETVRRAAAVSYIASGPHGLPPAYRSSHGVNADNSLEWLYALDNQARTPPDLSELPQPASDVRVTADYWARTSRFGFSFVSDTSRAEPAPFPTPNPAEAIEFFVRGLYSDLLLFVMAQAIQVRELSLIATNALLSHGSAADVDQLRTGLLIFRRLYLRRNFAPQPPYDELLVRYYERTGFVANVEQIDHDLNALSADLQSVLGGQTNALLGIIAVVGLPFSIALTIWQGVSSSFPGLLLGLVAASAVSLALVFTTKARSLISAYRSKSPSNL